MSFNCQYSTLPVSSPPLVLKMGGVIVAPQQYPIKTRDRAHVPPMINCQNVSRRYTGKHRNRETLLRFNMNVLPLTILACFLTYILKCLLVHCSRLTSSLSTSESKARLVRNLIFNLHEQYYGREPRTQCRTFTEKGHIQVQGLS